MLPTSSRSGKENLEARSAAGEHLVQAVGSQLNIGFDDHFAGRHIHHIGRSQRSIQFRGFDFNLLDTSSTNGLERVRSDLAAGVRDLIALVQNSMRRLRTQKMRRLAFRRNSPLQLAIRDVNAIDGIEGLEDLLVGTQPQRAQEDRSQELTLAVDAHIERVLLVVLELHPRTAIRNDLAQEVSAIVRRLEKHTR